MVNDINIKRALTMEYMPPEVLEYFKFTDVSNTNNIKKEMTHTELSNILLK